MQEKIISTQYLRANPDHIFVFGDNTIRRGHGGAAMLRDEPNTYGFITKKLPTNDSSSFYKPAEYKHVFDRELTKLRQIVENNPSKRYLISKLGAGLANKYGIYQRVIRDGVKCLKQYDNVEFLYDIESE